MSLLKAEEAESIGWEIAFGRGSALDVLYLAAPVSPAEARLGYVKNTGGTAG
jgi:hypothetical protein